MRREYKVWTCGHCGQPRKVVTGDWLRERRQGAGLSMREMSRRIGISVGYLCFVETNRRPASERIIAEYEKLAAR